MDINWLLQPFDLAVNHFINGNKRLFWLYIISSLALALFALRTTSGISNKLKSIFDKNVWLHKSAKHDYAIWFLNGAIKLFIILPLLFSAAPIAIQINQFLMSTFGEMNTNFPSGLYVPFIFTFLLFLLDDFSRFLLHWLSHKVPLLWRFHQVHHSAEVLTPFTVYRIHPVESTLYASRLVLTQAVAIGLGVYFFGRQLDVIDVLGANAFVFVFNVLGANLRHSHIWLSWGKNLEKWFISPAQHQIHHSVDKAHYDKNFGSALAIWDRLFNSLLLANNTNKPEQFGLKNNKLTSLTSLYFLPFKFFRK
jgi:sterol desaturase/sphingolipid hydroxylase (fatty acid hydroxylase superfamily)